MKRFTFIIACLFILPLFSKAQINMGDDFFTSPLGLAFLEDNDMKAGDPSLMGILLVHALVTLFMVLFGARWFFDERKADETSGMSLRLDTKRYIKAVGILFIGANIGFSYLIYVELEPMIFIPYACFLMLIITYQYRRNSLQNLFHEGSLADKGRVKGDEIEEAVNTYYKSLLPDELLAHYQEKLHQKIEEHVYLDSELTLDSLAAELEISKHTLSQVLNLGIGKGFNEYINYYRIVYASGRLRDPACNLNIKELAFESGFSSTSTFTRNFKRQMRYTPSQYRLRKKE